MKITYTGKIEVGSFTYLYTNEDERILIDDVLSKALKEKNFIGEIKIEINEIPTGLQILDEGVEANDQVYAY